MRYERPGAGRYLDGVRSLVRAPAALGGLPQEEDRAGQAKWNVEVFALERQIATTPSETLHDITAKMRLLRHWREQCSVPGASLQGYLIHGVIADLEKMNSPIQ